MSRSLPEAQAYIDAMYQHRAEQMAYMQGVFDMIKPEISIIAHGPSAEAVAEYHNRLFDGLLAAKMTTDEAVVTARKLTAVWLKAQIAAAASPDTLRPRRRDD